MDPSELRVRRVFFLTESLATLRNADKSDIVLVCEGEEFYAHKIILEASSEYFAKLINSGFQESNTNRVEFKELDPATLNIILNFLYLGKVDQLQTPLQLKHVLKASHLMQIEDLFRYCCSNLILQLSTENFFEFLDLQQRYEIQTFCADLLDFWILHNVELLSHEQFLLLPFEQIKGLGQLLKSNNVKQDDFLLNFVKWVQHDSADRQRFASIMLEHIEFSLVTKQCFKALYKNDCLETMPKDFAAKIKELGFATLCSDDETDCSQTVQHEMKLMCKRPHLVFFSTQHNVQVHDPSTNHITPGHSETRYCFQQFDLLTMSWQPVFDIDADFCLSNSCEHQQLWYNIKTDTVKSFNARKCNFKGSDDLCIGMPNLQILQPFSSSSYKDVTVDDHKICYFKGYIYIIGGRVSGRYCYNNKNMPWTNLSIVSYSKPDCSMWQNAVALPHAVYPITVLTSPYHLYVLDNCSTGQLRIQYNSAPDKNVSWEAVYVATLGLLTTLNFFVFENTIHALYLHNGNTVHVKYCHDEKKMKTNTFPGHPEGIKRVTRVCVGVFDQQILFYVSTVDDSFRIPNFVWDPKTGQWKKLPDQSGNCLIPRANKCMEILQ